LLKNRRVASGLHIPRLVVAATSSGVGKTTASVGLVAALRARGLKVAVFKCGPDYLDPTYHTRVAENPSQNLDGWMMGREAVIATFTRTARLADIAIIEGMMGLFDSATPTGEEGSTAEIAKWLGAPVLLVVDASGMARTIAAVATGFRHFDPDVHLAGLVCNRVGGRAHLDLLREACSDIAPIVGGLPENPQSAFPERHLGLLAADEQTVPDEVFRTWGKLAAEWLDLDRIVECARSAPTLETFPSLASEAGPGSPRCRIGIAFDEAFHFYYEDNLRRLESLGATLVRFSPVRDAALPEIDGLYFSGGYPEAAAERLASNRVMIEAVRSFAATGGPIYAECGGLMYLSSAIRTIDGQSFPMIGIIASEAVMSERLQALGYVEVETLGRSLLGPRGLHFRGHQFRYSTLRPEPAEVKRVYSVKPRWGGEAFAEGYCTANVLASYVHAHWASSPSAAEGFVHSCAEFRARRK
jgi:cobyrinic acid a,c-diamide synthase